MLLMQTVSVNDLIQIPKGCKSTVYNAEDRHAYTSALEPARWQDSTECRGTAFTFICMKFAAGIGLLLLLRSEAISCNGVDP